MDFIALHSYYVELNLGGMEGFLFKNTVFTVQNCFVLLVWDFIALGLLRIILPSVTWSFAEEAHS